MLSEKDKHLLRGLFQHSDFTVAGRNHHKFRRQVDRHLANGGLLTDDVLNSFFIRNNKDVVIALKAYNLFMRPDDVDWEGKQYSSSFMPPDMYYYIIAFLEGEHKSATSNALPATWAVDIDVMGIFFELTERFKCTKTEAYELIADNLIKHDPDNGVSKVQKYITRHRKKTR